MQASRRPGATTPWAVRFAGHSAWKLRQTSGELIACQGARTRSSLGEQDLRGIISLLFVVTSILMSALRPDWDQERRRASVYCARCEFCTHIGQPWGKQWY